MEKKIKTMSAIASIAVVAVAIFLVFRYVPFGERAKFIGTWYQPEFYSRAITFNSDGTCSDMGWPGKWKLENGELIIKTKDGTDTSRWHYLFSDSGKKLHLEGRGTWVKWGD